MLTVLWIASLGAFAFVRVQWLALPPVTRGNFASIEKHLVQSVDAAVAAGRTGAVAFALLRNGQIVTRHAAGQADPASGHAVDPIETRFVVASVSKAVTAWGVMRLVEEGMLGLDEPIAPRLKRWRLTGRSDFSGRVTARHLLSHTAGVEDDDFVSDSDTLVGSLSAVRVVREPGTVMMYSSAGYAILQLLVEEVTQRSFDDAMRERLFVPLQMQRSTFDASRGGTARIAAAFDHDLTIRPRRRYAAPAAAALLTTAEDLALFARAHARANPVLSEETLRRMSEPQPATGGSWGLGLTRYAEDKRGVLVIGHSGGTLPAWGAVLRVNPRSGNGLVLLSSGGRGALNRLSHDWVYWETGQLTAEGRRQMFYDDMPLLGIAFVAGLVVIALASW